MKTSKAERIYRVVMLIIITALISSIITAVVVNERITSSSSIKNIAEGDGTTGIETTLAAIRTILEEEYIGELDDERMLEMAVKGYVAGVGDEYTAYYTPEEMNQEYDTAMGNYVGIGIYMIVNYEEGTITIVEAMENSPALEAGLQENDLITKVDGEEVTVDNVSEISDKIKGEEGTSVKLEIKRGEEEFEVEIERRRIEVSHIESRMLDGNIAYIQVLDFDGGVAKEFKENYEQLKSEGATSLIIDIRSNGGGVVDEAIDMLEMICDNSSTLLIETDKDGKETTSKREETHYILVESDSIIGHYKYNYETKTVENGDTKTTGKVFTNEELIGEKYERLRKYLKEKLRISEDDLDTDIQVIIQASNGYYEGEESTAWLQGNSSNATIISDGSGLVPKRNVHLANTRLHKYHFTFWYENSSNNWCI